MKVAIDAQALGSQTGGDETYMRNLTRALAGVSPGDEYVLLLDQPLPKDRFAGIEQMHHIVLRQKLFRRIPVSIPLAVAHEGVDVLHAQYVGPPLCTAPVVVSIHDISFERYPQFFTQEHLRHLRILVPPAARRAAAVLTLSEFSRQDIVRRYCVPPERVIVTPCAADPLFRHVQDQARLAAIRTRYGTGDRFILCVSNLQPRKNLRTLITAYGRLRRAGAISHKLVLVGRKGWLYDDTFALARASGYADELIFTGYVPDEDLVALYNAADLFVYPSIFEGFGLPALEAMACGTPVITSNTSALPETVGDAALMVDPLDVEALAGVIATVLRDEDLRTRLRAQGIERAAAFSWEATARIILKVYQQVLQKRNERRSAYHKRCPRVVHT
jgi:glycosyltransferase involved in cell wall biosynthesis